MRQLVFPISYTLEQNVKYATVYLDATYLIALKIWLIVSTGNQSRTKMLQLWAALRVDLSVKSQWGIVLIYPTMLHFSFFVSSCHVTLLFLYVSFSFLSRRINEASDFKDHKIQIASCLISLKVEPSPALSINLSGAPLIKIVLTHVLVRITHAISQRSLIWLMFLSAIFLCVSQSCWDIGRLLLLAVGCGKSTLSEERGPCFVRPYSSRLPLYEIHQHYFWRSLM